jgi:hypothetical protein
MAQASILDKCRILMLTESPVLEPTAAARIEQWVQNGGILIIAGNSSIAVGSRLHDLTSWRHRLFAPIEPIAAAKSRLLAQRIRRIGSGATVNLCNSGEKKLNWMILVEFLSNTTNYLPRESPVSTVDCRMDGRYATCTRQGIIWYDGKTGITWEG